MVRYEIWWVDMNPSVGAEIQKVRPCVVLSPKELSYLKTRIIAPITSKSFKAPYHLEFTLLGKRARILTEQIKSVSVERFRGKITSLDSKNIEKLKDILQTLFLE